MHSSQPRLITIGTQTPEQKYTQAEILEHFQITDKKISRIFNHSHIKSRYLSLPKPNPDGSLPDEDQAALLKRHQRVALEIGEGAIKKALKKAGLIPEDIDYISVVSTTGFLCPSLTAFYIKKLGMRQNVQRIDIVGMGCNGGLNGMQPVVNFCALHPDAIGLLVCVEVCSAMYVIDNTLNTAVVNSLFGDGAAAAVISAKPFKSISTGPKILGFNSHLIHEAIDAMRIELQENKYAFYLDKHAPYLLGLEVKKPIDNLLKQFNLKRRNVHHWIVHSGGRKVIDSLKYALNITTYQMRHTINILENYGNLSSGSFLFSHERLLNEGVAQSGETIVMITMGPGSTIECCLGEF
jgi:3,5-dihydroxyphenylacetyl-CoA synthase